MKKFVDPRGLTWKMSNKFGIGTYAEGDEDNVKLRCIVTGSPADIRKMAKIAVAHGYIPYHCGHPIMREGRLYEIHFVEDDTFFYVYRARAV